MKRSKSHWRTAALAAGCLLLTGGCADPVSVGVGTDIVGSAASQPFNPPPTSASAPGSENPSDSLLRPDRSTPYNRVQPPDHPP